MDRLNHFFDQLDRALERRTRDLRPTRAVVKALSGGKVKIQDLGATTQSEELYARLAGFALAVDDEVIVVRVGGKPVVLGKLQRATPTGYALDAPFVSDGDDNIRFGASAQSSADTSSTTSTSTYQDAMTLALALPAGTWSVVAVGGVALIHSAGQSAAFRVDIDGANNASRTTPNLSTTVYTLHNDNDIVGLAGNRTINVKVQFRSQDAGTTTADNPWAFAIARRTGP